MSLLVADNKKRMISTDTLLTNFISIHVPLSKTTHYIFHKHCTIKGIL